MDEGAATVPTAVLDTNAVLDALVFADPGSQALAAALAEGRLRWVASPSMLAELAAVLPRPELDRWRSAADAALAAARALAHPAAEPPASALRCSDPDDQKFIDLALAVRAEWLLTRDRALLRLAPAARRAGVAVCSPARFRG